MNWSDIVQAGASVVTLGIVGWLVTWIYRLYHERERSLKERYEGKVDLLEERLKLKDEEISRERRARERYAELVEEERKLWDIQKSAGIAPDGALPHEPIELSAELKHTIVEILSRLEQISIELPLPKGHMLISRGNAYATTGQYEKATQVYNEAIKLDPDDRVAYHNRGLAYMELGQLKAAVDDFSKVIELRPDMVEGYCNRGRTYGKLGEYKQSIEDLSKALQIDPDHQSAYCNRGASYAYMGQFKQALKDFNKAIELEPNDANNYYNKACAYSLMKKPDEAIAVLQKSISLDKDFVETARSDKDFNNIRDDPRFKDLLSL